jgi:hypothetical protein
MKRNVEKKERKKKRKEKERGPRGGWSTEGKKPSNL